MGWGVGGKANRVKPKLKCDGDEVRQTSLSVFVIFIIIIFWLARASSNPINLN